MPNGDEIKNLPVKVAGMNEPERVYQALERSGGNRMAIPYIGNEGQGGSGEFSLRDILYILFRHKWKIVFTFLLLSCLTVYSIGSMGQLFEAEARVFIRGDRVPLAMDPTGEGNTFLKASRDGGSVRSEMGLILSPVLAEMVVDKLGAEKVLGASPGALDKPRPSWAAKLGARGWPQQTLNAIENGYHTTLSRLHLSEPKLTPRQQAIRAISGGLDVAPTASESSVLKVTYRAGSPETAKMVLDALVGAYRTMNIQIHKTQVSPEFFQTKIETLQTQLHEKESKLDSERKRLNVASLEGQKASLINQETALDMLLKDNAMQVQGLKAKITQYDQLQGKRQKATKSGKGTPVPARTNPALDQLRTRLLELQLQEADLSSRFTDKNPSLVDVRNKITQVKALMSGQSTSSKDLEFITEADPMGQDLEKEKMMAQVELESQNAREATLLTQIDQTRKNLNVLLANEQGLKQLEREVDNLDNAYKQYLKGWQTAEISSALDKENISNVTIAQPATLPMEPVKSQRKLLALLGFGIFLSLMGGLGWAFGLEYCDHSLKTNEDVERKLGLPVLVALPYIKHHKPLMIEEGNS